MKVYLSAITIMLLLHSCKNVSERPVVINDKVVAKIFSDNGRQGLKDTLGNVLVPAKYDYIDDYPVFGLLQTDLGGKKIDDFDLVGYEMEKIGLIDTKGNIIAEPQYDEVNFNWFPLGLVKKNGKFGYIDRKGKIKIPIEYLHASPFQNGFAVVKTKSGYGLIDSTNSLIILPKYDSLMLGYAEGYSKDTMLLLFDDFTKSSMITSKGKIFETKWKDSIQVKK